MDFKEQEVDFQEADRRFAELEQQRDAGTISDEEFETQRQRLMVLDGEGRWWAKSRETGEWRYHDGNAWVPGTPPGYEEETTSSTVQTLSAPKTTGGKARRMPLWIPMVGLGGLALIGVVLIVWVLVPTLQGSSTPDEGAGQGREGGGEATPNGAGFDAAFVHRATPDNISANSTYLDNPLTNGDPKAIVYVTQNWNPDDSDGTYNNHPIGVWYDNGREKWAIFNQDRAEMPEGADFNVGIIKEARQE